MVSSIIKVCPKAEELSVVRVNIPCPVDGCSSVLPHAGSLRIHLSKTHRITEDSDGTGSVERSDGDQNVIKQYHCPVQNCVYNALSKRHFTSRKLLKQHYMKVHADKKHKCTKCGQGFGLERDCRRHQQTCGIIFHCKTCDCPFSSIEATINHCNIKQHEIPEECKNLRSSKPPSSAPPRTILILQAAPPNPSLSPSIQSNSSTSGTSVLRPLLPKPIINATILPAPKTIRTSELAPHGQLLIAPFEKSPPPITAASRSISIQTDGEKNLLTLTPSASVDTEMPYLHNPRPNYSRNIAQTDCTFFANPGRKVGKRLSKISNYSLHKFTSSTGIQTAVSVPPVKKKSHRNMVGTQTVGDYILTTAMSSAQIPIRRISQGSQVNPHGKQRTQRNSTMESSHTQTMEMQSPRWKKRRRASTVQQDDQNEIPTSENTPSFLLLKETGTSGELTDNHTQTNLSNSAPAISTQTHMSCLINSLTNGRSAPDNCSSFSSQQSTETQTISSVLQHVMAKNVNTLYPIADTYDQPAHAQPMSFASLDSDLQKKGGSASSCDKELLGTKTLLENNMESTMQTEPEMSLIYSSLTNEPISSSLASRVSHNTYPPFTTNLSQNIENNNCNSLLSTLTNPHTDSNYVCESPAIDSSISQQSQLPISDPVKTKETASETGTVELPFQSFIDQNLNNSECSLPGFSNPNSQRNSLTPFHNLESIAANQEPEDDKRKPTDHNGATSSGLLCSLVNKDPILCSSTAFSDIGDSNDVLNYPQIGSFDNERHFASSGTSPLDITDSSLLTFEKGISTTDNNGNTESFLLQASKDDEPGANKLNSQGSNLNDLANKSFFHSTLGHTMESRSESSKVFMNSSMNTESDFSTDQLCLNSSQANLASCRSKLFNNSVPSNVLTTRSSSPERRTISTCMDDLMDVERLTLSNAGCGSLMSTQFAPLVADIEVQTLALDNDFEALLNSTEHSRSSSSVIDMYTQTVEDMLDLLGNTTETQTTVDDTFFPGLEFTDIETQTTAGELDCLETRSLITAGTQTTLSNQNLSRDVEFSDMETQTGFNVCDLDTFLTDSHTQTTFDELEDFLSGLNSQV